MTGASVLCANAPVPLVPRTTSTTGESVASVMSTNSLSTSATAFGPMPPDAGLVNAVNRRRVCPCVTAPLSEVTTSAMTLASHAAAELLPQNRNAIQDIQALNPLIGARHVVANDANRVARLGRLRAIRL